jgi:murein DD-endopeptidase MepM/ murein hydrolase activator NlpD
VEKKFKFSDNPTIAKAVYGAIIALLCITAIVVGIIAANNRKKSNTPDPTPPINDETNNTDTGDGENKDEGNKEEEKTTFIAPASGKVSKVHSTSIPVYSETLEAWKIHTGIDIMTEEGAPVFAVAAGEVTAVYADPMLGNTVEVTHANGIVSRYSNLGTAELPVVGTVVESGAKIGAIGDSAISEIADEAHLHFEMFSDKTSVDPLEYISEEAKEVSLGIDENEAA